MPAFDLPGLDFSRNANADLSASQYFIVAAAVGGVALCGAGAVSLGVVQNKPSLNQSAAIRMEGITRVVAGAAFADGVLLMSDANGRAILATAGNFVIGKALGAAAGLGSQVGCKLDSFKI